MSADDATKLSMLTKRDAPKLRFAEADYYPPSLNDGKRVFVFESNVAGRHGAGAALEASLHWGAIKGAGLGRQGQSYAIPTKRYDMTVRSLWAICLDVEDFVDYARCHPELEFLVTAIGTGLAGYRHADIAPMFRDAPGNCVLPRAWREILEKGLNL